MTQGLSSTRSIFSSTSSAGWPRCTTLAPVLESGSRSALPGMSTCSHLSVMISPSRQPVRISRRVAAMDGGEFDSFGLHLAQHLANTLQFCGAQEPLALFLRDTS